mmetsp:Transcript_35749/g.78549  ORF Transcript_35749/g.78549 Transcript_35749/m.78549 type:complete len:204 (+) Transcript_35749:813-1424(+)
MFDLGTRTLSNSTSQWPCGASSKPSARSRRTTLSPGALLGTRTIEWRAWRGRDSSGTCPMKMKSSQRGWAALEVHHFRPLSTRSSPSSTTVACMLVASLEATSGSVIAKADRIRPSSSGVSHCSFCAAVPNMCSTSMLPVSGALQLNTSGARSDLPISSANGAYSLFVSPETSGRKRFHSPCALASALRASISGGTDQRSGPS